MLTVVGCRLREKKKLWVRMSEAKDLLLFSLSILLRAQKKADPSPASRDQDDPSSLCFRHGCQDKPYAAN
jgi:hypothetical protein